MSGFSKKTIESCFNMTVLQSCNRCKNSSNNSYKSVIDIPKIDKTCPNYKPCEIEIIDNSYFDLLDKEANQRKTREAEIIGLSTSEITEADYKKLSN